MRFSFNRVLSIKQWQKCFKMRQERIYRSLVWLLVFSTALHVSPVQEFRWESQRGVLSLSVSVKLNNNLLPQAEANAQTGQMCMSFVTMLGMMAQMKASAVEKEKAQTIAYMQGQMKKDLSELYDSRTSRERKIEIQKRLVSKTPLTKEQFDQIKNLSPGQQKAKLAELSSQLQEQASKGGLESSSNNAMMMIVVGMIICALMSAMGGGGGGGGK